MYLNSPDGLLNNSYSLRLTGPPESRFGFSLSTLGDINKVCVSFFSPNIALDLMDCTDIHSRLFRYVIH